MILLYYSLLILPVNYSTPLEPLLKRKTIILAVDSSFILNQLGQSHKMRSHIVESCPLTKLNGGLSRLHPADEDAVSWLTSYG